MSLILDALNRSREDSGEVPGLATRHAYSEQQPDRRLLLLVIALLCTLLVIAWLVWDRSDSDKHVDMATPQEVVAAGPGQSAVAPAAPVVQPERQPLKADSAAAMDSADNAIKEPATPAVEPAVAPEVEALYQPAERTPDILAAGPAPKTKPQLEREQAAPTPVAVAAPEETDVDIGRLVRQAEGDLEDARLAEHPAPFISELSQQAKDAIPTVYYQRHEYSGRASQSRVVLNGKPLAKGDSPAPGIRVEEILADSVVLNHEGTQFRLRALNSWVNL